VFRLDLTPEQTAALVAAFEQLLAKGLHHSAISAPVATGVETGAAYLAQAYVVGDSLDVVLRERGPLPLDEALHIVESIAAAIDAAADANVTHGSLHPRDIIISGDGAWITGLGVADALASVGARVPFRPPYSAQDAPSDMYSLAAIAFEAISGRRLSESNLVELEHERGPEISRVFAASVAANPELRPTRARDFASALREASAHIASAFASDAAPADRPLAPAFTSDAAPADRPLAPDAPLAPFAPDAPLAPFAPDAPLAPLAPDAPLAADAVTRGPEPDFKPEPEQQKHAPQFPASWSAQPPAVFQQSPVFHEVKGPRRFFSILVISVIVVWIALAYFFITGRRSTPPTAAKDTKTTVAETTVELPASAQPAQTAQPAAPAAPSNAPETRATNAPPPPPMPSRPAAGVTAKPPARSSVKAVRGNLLIRSTPANADVAVNGEPRGKTPITMRDLPLGSYTIRIAREGYAPEERRVQLTSQRATAAMSFSLRPAPPRSATASSGPAVANGVGSISVQSRPSGARVSVNNRLVGTTPLTIPDMPAGSATVRIEMDGYQTWATTIHVNAGEPARVNASLDRR